MSSLPLVSTAAPGRFVPVAASARSILILERLSAVPKLAGVTPASRLEVRPSPQMVSSGIRELDALTGGRPRGCLTEICGPASSGRTSILLATLSAATQRQEICALVDISDAFNPHSAAAAGVNFERMLWVRCGHLQKSGSPQRHRKQNRKTGRASLAGYRLAFAKRRLRDGDHRPRRYSIEDGAPHSVDLLVSFPTRG